MAKWRRAIWRGRGKVEADAWRLHFVVVVDGEPVGMQDPIGMSFSTFGTVTTFSWLSSDHRGRGLGREMREAVLHLAFDGLGAKEATSDAFVDNQGSHAISRGLGYEPNGSDWATRQGEPTPLNRWRLTRHIWNSTAETTFGSTTSRLAGRSYRCPEAADVDAGGLEHATAVGSGGIATHIELPVLAEQKASAPPPHGSVHYGTPSGTSVRMAPPCQDQPGRSRRGEFLRKRGHGEGQRL